MAQFGWELSKPGWCLYRRLESPMRLHARHLLVGSLAVVSGVLAQAQYFPHGLFSSNPRFDRDQAAMTSDFLSIASEPPLMHAKVEKGHTIFRLIWLPSFDDFWILRLDVGPHGDGQLNEKVIGGRGSQHSGQLIRSDQKHVSFVEIAKLLSSTAIKDFWSLPSRGKQSGCDGAFWILEGVQPSFAYHVVDRWSPDSGPVKEIGTSLAQWAGLRSRFGALY